MYLSIIILIGTIVLLFGYIKFHIDLQFSPDERKWYEKIRFLFPLLVIPIFGAIYYFWNMYPDILIDRDSQTVPMETGAQLAWTIEGLLSPQNSSEPMSKFEEIGSKYGTFGDSYGSLNTLFTGFAFSGLIISIFIQLLELRQTRKELSGQKTALLGQQEEFQKQTQILENQQKLIDNQFKETRKQNFINEFYGLLKQRNIILNSISLYKEDSKYSGLRVISELSNKFQDILEDLEDENNNKKYFEEKLDDEIFNLFGYYDYQISGLFKFYITIIDTINTSDSIQEKEKEKYINIIKKLIGVDEKIVLMWYGIHYNQIKNICNKYSLLNGIYHESFIPIALTHFKHTAFGKSKEWNKVFDNHKKTVKIEA